MYRLTKATGRLRPVLLLPALLVATCGSVFQGPISGRIEVPRTSDAEDVIVQLRCHGPGLHGHIQTDQEHTRVRADGRFSLLFSLQFPTTERCHLDIVHPRYRAARIELTDDFAQRVDVVALEDWPSFFAAGPGTSEPTRPPWPEPDIGRHASNVLLWLDSFPERQRHDFARYVPDLHALYRQAATTVAERSQALKRLLDAIGRFEAETGYAYPYANFPELVRAGDARGVREYLDGGVLVRGDAGLSVAVREGHLDVVQTLLELAPSAQRALIDAGCDSPLFAVVPTRQWPVALALLASGANPTAVCNDRQGMGDALAELARRGETAWLQRFLEAGVPADLPSRRGTTALAEAAEEGRIATVKLLLRYGANPNAHTGAGVPLLQDAIAKGYLDVVQALRRAGAEASDA